jgi:glutamate formiminotransferase
VTVLNRHIDPDHNRSVITFVAAPEVIVEAAMRAVARAAELIDLTKHQGVHPRIGATDVLPFVPVSGVSIDECITLAHTASRRIAQELSIPVYFYERAALRPERVRLENVRGGGFEQLRAEIALNPDRAPDVGEKKLHPTAGAIAVGARPFLIAFNVNLRTSDIAVARRIARAVRERNGGLPFVKALGFELQSRGVVQVSMNLTDYEQTSIARAFTAVQREAERQGVAIDGAEIVGLSRDSGAGKPSGSKETSHINGPRSIRARGACVPRTGLSISTHCHNKTRTRQSALLCLLWSPRSRAVLHFKIGRRGQFPG